MESTRRARAGAAGQAASATGGAWNQVSALQQGARLRQSFQVLPSGIPGRQAGEDERVFIGDFQQVEHVNFIRDNIFLIAVALYCIGALAWPYIRKGARITSSQATALINKGKTAIIDIRDQKQYQAGHILNAVHVPFANLQDRMQKLEKYKGQAIIIVDEAGKESSKAASILKKEGFSQINILKGGMASWLSEGLPVSK